jgi:penicillin-binding protein 2
MILDRKGKILAGNKLGFNITVIPADIDEKSIQELAPILNLTPEELKRKIEIKKSWSRNVPVEIKRGLTWEELARIEERLRDFSGVDIELEPVRSYPEGDTACHLVGYLGEISQ